MDFDAKGFSLERIGDELGGVKPTSPGPRAWRGRGRPQEAAGTRAPGPGAMSAGPHPWIRVGGPYREGRPIETREDNRNAVQDSNCLFCRIAAGEIPASLVREDEHTIAFRDIAPQAPVHVLVIPRRHVLSLFELDDPGLAGACLHAAAEVAREQGLAAGWRLIANSGADGGQEVPHLHLHILGGRPLGPMLSSSSTP